MTSQLATMTATATMRTVPLCRRQHLHQRTALKERHACFTASQHTRSLKAHIDGQEKPLQPSLLFSVARRLVRASLPCPPATPPYLRSTSCASGVPQPAPKWLIRAPSYACLVAHILTKYGVPIHHTLLLSRPWRQITAAPYSPQPWRPLTGPAEYLFHGNLIASRTTPLPNTASWCFIDAATHLTTLSLAHSVTGCVLSSRFWNIGCMTKIESPAYSSLI